MSEPNTNAVTFTFVYDFEQYVKITYTDTTLSAEQIQVLAGLMFAVSRVERYTMDDTILCSLEGNTMKSTVECGQFVWEGNIIKHTFPDVDDECRNDPDGVAVYQVSREGEYTVLTCREEKVRVTFKDGMLESMDDEPAVST